MKLKLVSLTLFSSILLPLALPNELFLSGNPFLGLFCISFFFYAVYQAPSFRFAAFLGVIFGGISTLLANYWLKNFNEYAFYTLTGPIVGYIGYNALLAAIIHGFSKIRSSMRPFLTAMLFAVYEYLKSTGFVGYPYGLIAHPVHTILPFIQFVDITGIWGLSFLCAYLNSLVAESLAVRFPFAQNSLSLIFHRRKLCLRQKSLFALALVLIAFAYGSIRLAIGFREDKSFDALLIQQNIDPWDSGRAVTGLAAARELTLRGLAESLQKNGRLPDLVIWNETALRYAVDLRHEHPLGTNSVYSRYFPNLFTEFHTTTLTGAPVIAPLAGRYYNAAILVTKEGKVPQFYAKQHPVPFVESIPFMDIIFIRDFFEKNLRLSNFWLMGDKPSVFDLPLADGGSVRFGVPICFEDVYPDICREFVKNGAEVLINITNDSWSETKSALTQHIAAARFRSIETHKTLLRSTNAGLTCVVDASGAIIASIPLFEAGYLLSTIPVTGTGITTLYTILGDWLPYVFMLFLLILLIDNALGDVIRRLIRSLLGKLRVGRA